LRIDVHLCKDTDISPICASSHAHHFAGLCAHVQTNSHFAIFRRFSCASLSAEKMGGVEKSDPGYFGVAKSLPAFKQQNEVEN
jgi:hypothetical protein